MDWSSSCSSLFSGCSSIHPSIRSFIDPSIYSSVQRTPFVRYITASIYLGFAPCPLSSITVSRPSHGLVLSFFLPFLSFFLGLHHPNQISLSHTSLECPIPTHSALSSLYPICPPQMPTNLYYNLLYDMYTCRMFLILCFEIVILSFGTTGFFYSGGCRWYVRFWENESLHQTVPYPHFRLDRYCQVVVQPSPNTLVRRLLTQRIKSTTTNEKVQLGRGNGGVQQRGVYRRQD